MDCMPRNPATRRYTQRFLVAMTFYVLAIFTSAWVFKHLHPSGASAYLLAILPALPILATIVIIGLYLVEEKDEFQRNLQIQSMMWGIGATLSVTTVWGFLENFTQITHLQPYLVFPIFWFFVGIASAVLRVAYR